MNLSGLRVIDFTKPSYYKEICGNKIAFYEAGKGEKTIVFIHGNSMSAEYYKFQFESELAEQYRLVSFDFPGNGNSPKACVPENGYGFKATSNILLEVAKYIGVSYLVAHSLGSNVALFAAAKDSSAFKGLFLSGALIIDDIQTELANATHPNPAVVLFFKGEHTEEERRQIFEANVYRPTDQLYSLFRALTINSASEIREYVSRDIANTQFYLGHKKFIKDFNKPVAIVEGEYDSMVNFDNLSKITTPALWRKSPFQVTDCGHCLHIEKPNEVNKLIKAFVEENSLPNNPV